MKKCIFSVLIALFVLSVSAQQQLQVKSVLDKTAENFRKSGAVAAEFVVKSFANGRGVGESAGSIRLKGEKFFLKTEDSETWFDGKTQWSYRAGSDEVTISTPTQEELQNINPYTLLYMYQKGFSYKFGSVKNFRGKPVETVVLTALNKKQDLACIVLYVTKETYQPVYILLEQRGNKNRSEITITNYQTKQNYADSIFIFDKKKYPNAEIIDLR